MIAYVLETNIDDRILIKASQILRNGGLICFPLDTSWVAVCDPFNKEGVNKLYKLKNLPETKHFTLLCTKFEHAQEISHIHDAAFKFMKRLIPGPYTFILEAQKKITKFLKASKADHEIGLRFPETLLSQKILKYLDQVLLSTKITPSMIKNGDENNLIYSALIEDHFSKEISLILDPGEDLEFCEPTTIIDLRDSRPVVIRFGRGEVNFEHDHIL